MKKILAALLVLALVAPAMAVNFTLTPGAANSGKLTVAYDIGATEVVRGMALKVTVLSGNAKIDGTGDVVLNNAVAKFNTFVDWAYSNQSGYNVGMGHPIAKATAAGAIPDTGGVIADSNSFSVCMGYLDQGGNQAGLTVDSFFDIFFTLTTESVVKVELDTLRGGIVGDNIVASDLPKQATLPVLAPETITTPTVAKTTAAPAIATRVNGGRSETFVASGATSSYGHALQYLFTWGDGTNSGWVSSATQTKTYTYTAAATYNVTVQARCATDTAVVSAVSAAIALTTEEVKSTAGFYSNWALFNRPPCWAFQRNCRGDVNGARQGNSVNGYQWVFTDDLNIFLAAYGIKEPAKGPGIATITYNGVPGICADNNRARQGNSVNGYQWVFTDDLNIFLASYGVKEPTKGPGVPVCDKTNYHYWTN